MTAPDPSRSDAPLWRPGNSIHEESFYSPTRPANLFLHQQRARCLLKLLSREHCIPLDKKRILDVGCGTGQQLVEFETWGARREDLAGIDVNESRVCRARDRLCSPPGAGRADIRFADAVHLPWPNGVFDIVYQSVAFTSMPHAELKKTVAAEMLRVLKPDGVIIWYDFIFRNPKNKSVQGIGAREIRSLFPRCTVSFKRVTLAPPIARVVVPVSWMFAVLLEAMIFLNTHYLAAIRRKDSAARAA